MKWHVSNKQLPILSDPETRITMKNIRSGRDPDKMLSTSIRPYCKFRKGLLDTDLSYKRMWWFWIWEIFRERNWTWELEVDGFGEGLGEGVLTQKLCAAQLVSPQSHLLDYLQTPWTFGQLYPKRQACSEIIFLYSHQQHHSFFHLDLLNCLIHPFLLIYV